MTEKKEEKSAVWSRFWAAYDKQDWKPDNSWTTGNKEVKTVSGLKLKMNFDNIKTESKIILQSETASMIDLPILYEENKKTGIKANVRRVQVRLKFILRDMMTGDILDEWYGEGIGESPDQHASGSAHGFAFRNGILGRFNIVDNGDEASDTETIDFTLDAKKTENDNVKKMMEPNKLPVNEPPATLKPRVAEVKSTTAPPSTDDTAVTDATMARAKKIFMNAMKAGMESTAKNTMVAAYNSAAVMQRNEKDVQAWIERYKGYEVK